MELKDRIIKIISSEGLTSSVFADTIGVQRSSISHIISGRNKPSLDFLQKTLINFPKYKAEWLIMGAGDIYKQPTQSNLFKENEELSDQTSPIPAIGSKEVNNIEDTVNKPAEELKEVENNTSTDVSIKDINNVNNKNVTKTAERIVIFYSDKTFREYHPD